MNQNRLGLTDKRGYYLLALLGFVGFIIALGNAGCAATSLEESAKVMSATAVVVDTAAKATIAADRVAQEAIVEAVRSNNISLAAGRQKINAYRQERARVLAVTEQTRATLDSLKNTLATLPASINANDAAIDAELNAFTAN